MRYLDRLQQRPAYQRAVAIDDALIAAAAQR
jgi:glutathione S-transferase